MQITESQRSSKDGVLSVGSRLLCLGKHRVKMWQRKNGSLDVVTRMSLAKTRWVVCKGAYLSTVKKYFIWVRLKWLVQMLKTLHNEEELNGQGAPRICFILWKRYIRWTQGHSYGGGEEWELLTGTLLSQELRKAVNSGWWDGSVDKSTSHSSLMTWIWVLRTHANVRYSILNIYNPGPPTGNGSREGWIFRAVKTQS